MGGRTGTTDENGIFLRNKCLKRLATAVDGVEKRGQTALSTAGGLPLVEGVVGRGQSGQSPFFDGPRFG
jgi:hypothetical protein